MKLKKSLIVFVLLLGIANLVGATPNIEKNYRSPIFMGEVIEVYKENDKVTRITVDGFLKSNNIFKQRIIGIITEDTKVINSENNKKEENIEIKEGDLVYMRVSEAFTKSEPPQTVIKRIFITKTK